jgi:DNA adenine methylase
VVIPFLKWAGGKRWLFDRGFVDELPPFQRYVEPFLGGGAGFFALQPREAMLSDLNCDLIELYEVVRDHPCELEAALRVHQAQHCREYYYLMRDLIDLPPIDRAARTLYLNRTCWNGLYRLNLRGQFNVPVGTKTAVLMPTDNFKRASSLLKRAELRHCDFEETIDCAGVGDLIFADPPYTVRHNINGFVKYNEKLFRWSDQVRLRDALVRAAARGARVLVTNANHESVLELYDGLGELSPAYRSSVISGKAAGRTVTSELVIRL